MTKEQLEVGENIETFYARVDKALKHILKDTTKTGTGKFSLFLLTKKLMLFFSAKGPASILIASHAPFVDSACQILLKQPARTDERMRNVANYFKYIGTLTLEEESKDKWRIIPPPVRTFRYSSNERFLWKKVFKDALGGGMDDDD